MKKLMSLMALAVVASVVAASAQEVLSANAVGYVKRTVPAGKLQIVTVPFDNIASEDGSYKFGETQVAQEAPKDTTVMFWDPESQSWDAGSKGKKGWDEAQYEHPLIPGEAFFLKNPDATQPLEVTAAGEVPSNAQLSRSYAQGGLSIVAYAYPVDVKFGDTELADQLVKDDQVMFWDAETQSWDAGSKGKKGWDEAQAEHIVQAGEGFFIKAANGGTWEAVKPYTWP